MTKPDDNDPPVNSETQHQQTDEDEAEGASSPKKLKLSTEETSLSNGHLLPTTNGPKSETSNGESASPSIDDVSATNEAPSDDAIPAPDGQSTPEISTENDASLRQETSSAKVPAADTVSTANESSATSGANSLADAVKESDAIPTEDDAKAEEKTSSEKREPKEEEAVEESSSASSSAAATPIVVPSSTIDSDSEIEILSSDDEEIRKKRDEESKAKSHKAKQVLNSIKKIDLKALSSKIKLNVSKQTIFKKEVTKDTSDGLSPAATSSPSCASDEGEVVKKENVAKAEVKEEDEDDADVDDDDDDDDDGPVTSKKCGRRNGLKGSRSWQREGSATTEGSSRCSTPCEDPLEREPEERVARNGEEDAPREEGLTAESVREAALKNAAIDEEYNVKNILSRLKAASLTLNNMEAVRGAGDDDDDAGVEIVEKQKLLCEIILESSDEEEENDEEDKKDKADNDDVQVVANPNIKQLEQTQARKVAEQLSSAGEFLLFSL